MRVLCFTSLYPNNVWSHHGVFIKERMAHFARLDDNTLRVVAPVPYFPPLKLGRRWLYSRVLRQEKIDGIDVYHPRYLMIPKIGMSLHGFQMFLHSLPLLRRIRREFEFDLIDAHYVYPDGLAGVLLGRYFGKPVVVSARGSDINLFPRFPFIRSLIKYTLRRADRIISVSDALGETMVELGAEPERISVIPNGVDVEKFHAVDRREAREELGLPDRRTIVSVGNLIPRKGFDLLIRAFHLLRRDPDYRDVFLVIAGEGECRGVLERMIRELELEDSVRLAGDIRHQDLFRWYGAAELCCLVSTREGYPNVLLESLACGTPVVASRIDGNSELVTDEVGVLVDRDEHSVAKGIAGALGRSWQSEQLADFIGKRTWNRVALSVSAVFDSVVQNGASVCMRG